MTRHVLVARQDSVGDVLLAGPAARAVLVPTAGTRDEEVAAAPEVAPDLLAAVELVLGSSDGELRR